MSNHIRMINGIQELLYRKHITKYEITRTWTVETSLRPLVRDLGDDQLVWDDDHRISLSIHGTMTIYPGGAWDGTSGPTVDRAKSKWGSAMHDAAYRLMRQGKLPEEQRGEADREFYRLLLAAGMFKIEAWVWYQGVVLFGSSPAKKFSKRKIHTAPKERNVENEKREEEGS